MLHADARVVLEKLAALDSLAHVVERHALVGHLVERVLGRSDRAEPNLLGQKRDEFGAGLAWVIHATANYAVLAEVRQERPQHCRTPTMPLPHDNDGDKTAGAALPCAFHKASTITRPASLSCT